MAKELEYIARKYVCIDQVPEGEKMPMSQSQMKALTKKRVQDDILRGKLSSSNRKKVEKGVFTKLKASFVKSAIWPQGSTIRIHFMDGTPKQQNWVKKVVQEQIEPIVSKLTFVWDVPIRESDVRITFGVKGQAWSFTGTQNKRIQGNKPTMSLGWLDDDTQFDHPDLKNTGTVVLHEFGHMLGMIHEHQNPKNNTIVWNKTVVSAKLASTNGWDQKRINENMFRKYGDRELCEKTKQMPDYEGKELDLAGYCGGEEVNGSEYDVHSIMHYFYPSDWILEGPKTVPRNTKLSDMDKLWLAKYYGDPSKYEIKQQKRTPAPNIQQTVQNEIDELSKELQIESFSYARSEEVSSKDYTMEYLIVLAVAYIAFIVYLDKRW